MIRKITIYLLYHLKPYWLWRRTHSGACLNYSMASRITIYSRNRVSIVKLHAVKNCVLVSTVGFDYSQKTMSPVLTSLLYSSSGQALGSRGCLLFAVLFPLVSSAIPTGLAGQFGYSDVGYLHGKLRPCVTMVVQHLANL